jgi:chromosome segregation ATPase
MRLFKKEAPQFEAEDVKATQDVVQAITAALKTGAEQQEIAAKRLGVLAKSITKMDANVRHSARLKSETQRLEAETSSLRADLDKQRAWAQEQTAKLGTVQKERDRLRKELDGAKSEVSARSEREAGLRESEIKLRREGEAISKELAQRTNRLEELALTQQRLQDDLAQANALLSSQSHKMRELQNAREELTLRLDEKTKAADASLSALRDLRLDHHAAKENLVAATSRLQSTEYEQSSQKNLFEDSLKRRADEILALKTQIEQLSTQLRIKDTMDSHFGEETAGLRQALETERERNVVNEQRLRNQAETEARQSRALAQSKSEFEALNAKFVNAMKDLDAIRQINRVQSQKLENYAQLNNAPAPNRTRASLRNDDPSLLKVVG